MRRIVCGIFKYSLAQCRARGGARVCVVFYFLYRYMRPAAALAGSSWVFLNTRNPVPNYYEPNRGNPNSHSLSTAPPEQRKKEETKEKVTKEKRKCQYSYPSISPDRHFIT